MEFSTKQQIQVIQEAVDFFESIPTNKWITGALTNYNHTGRCALGHLDHNNSLEHYDRVGCLQIWNNEILACLNYKNRLFDTIKNVINNSKTMQSQQGYVKIDNEDRIIIRNYIALVNDSGNIPGFRFDEDSPKKRILAFLKFLKQELENQEIRKTEMTVVQETSDFQEEKIYNLN